MHSHNVTIGGLDLELALTFGAAREISQKVGDLLFVSREATLEAVMLSAGIAHSPKWLPTVENVPLVFWIGAKHGGSDVKLERVQEAVFHHGLHESKEAMLAYLNLMITSTAREKMEGGGDATPGE